MSARFASTVAPLRSLLSKILAGLRQGVHVIRRGAVISVRLLLLAFLTILVTAWAISTPKDQAYRVLDPESGDCNMQVDENGAYRSPAWNILAAYGNDEKVAARDDQAGRWDTRLQCAIQRHEIPYSSADNSGRTNALGYTLAFLEFKEDGEPYELIKDARQLFTMSELTDRVSYIERHQWKPITQLEALGAHLRSAANRTHTDESGSLIKHSNYVIVFTHGWRHDASIGDGNVTDLRAYAAHVARFLRDRCNAGEREHCGREVTAVYIGWRGARLNEKSLHLPFIAIGNTVGARLDGDASNCSNGVLPSDKPLCWKNWINSWGETLASGVATLTLFDRKPVSEYIAPHALMALRKIEQVLKKQPGTKAEQRSNPNKMVVIGHSLGGNMLATALKDQLIKSVRNHPGDNAYFYPPLGDLVVLINPAAEASKWTDVQRAAWERIAFFEGEGDLMAGHRFFPAHQSPVVISVTSAYAWPPGGIRPQDCAIAMHEKLSLLAKGKTSPSEICARYKHFLETRKPGEFIFHDETPNPDERDCGALKTPFALDQAVEDIDRKKKIGIKSDLATYLAFPLFRGDFRPLGAMIAGVARDWRAACESFGAPTNRLERRALNFWRRVGEFVSDLPFQNTDIESSRTIGHLDPPRSPVSLVDSYRMPARQFGTTHEIRSIGWAPPSQADYKDIPADPTLNCPVSNDWLTRARKAQTNGTQWESALLAPPLDPDSANLPPGAGRPAVEMTHGFRLAGMLPITRANDPFWNMRAYDDVLMSHGGFMFSSFICAINQFVMDRPTRWPSPPTPAELQPPPAHQEPARQKADALRMRGRSR
ncbi:MAG: hypothetical protein ACR65X_04255 [Methylocystis sp.]